MNERRVSIHKAQGIHDDGSHEIESVEIVMYHTLPNDLSTDAVERTFQGDADLLARALIDHLPQGTLHRLLVNLMQHETKNLVGTVLAARRTRRPARRVRERY